MKFCLYTCAHICTYGPIEKVGKMNIVIIFKVFLCSISHNRLSFSPAGINKEV